jgi:hypothetical protein
MALLCSLCHSEGLPHRKSLTVLAFVHASACIALILPSPICECCSSCRRCFATQWFDLFVLPWQSQKTRRNSSPSLAMFGSFFDLSSMLLHTVLNNLVFLPCRCMYCFAVASLITHVSLQYSAAPFCLLPVWHWLGLLHIWSMLQFCPMDQHMCYLGAIGNCCWLLLSIVIDTAASRVQWPLYVVLRNELLLYWAPT